MKHRAGLTPERKKSAVRRCEDIEAALHSLLFDVLNGIAYCADIDKVSCLMTAVRRLRYRFESYPELPAEDEARIRELIDEGYPLRVARRLAKAATIGKAHPWMPWSARPGARWRWCNRASPSRFPTIGG